jgi:N-acetylmuramoyl-L-alanine amidase
MQYQLVQNRYADSQVSEPAKLELARAYARQGYGTRAETFYKSLVDSSITQEIGDVAAKELQVLKTQPKPVAPPGKEDSQIPPQPPPEPQQAKQPKSTAPVTDPEPLAPKSLTREFGLTAKTIVIDPGHGGKDPGALGSNNLQEKSIVFSISQKLREVLTAKGYTVLMTRDANRFIPLKKRTEFATQHKADLFLSIHANAAQNPKAKGIETYYLDVTSTDKASEKIAARENVNSGYSIQELETLLGGLIRESKSEDSKRLARHVQDTLVQNTGAIDRGVKHARFVVLIGTKVPAILIETGFVSNPVEGRKLATSAYQHKIATAIAEGVDKFLGKTGETPFVKARSLKFAAKAVERNK